jgi:hypothetical protein
MDSARARTHLRRRACHTPRIVNPCCLAHGKARVDVVVTEKDAREDVDMREVVVSCKWMEKPSGAEIRAERGRNRGRGGYGRFVATVAARVR